MSDMIMKDDIEPIIEEGKVPAVIVGLNNLMYLSNIPLEDAQKTIVEINGKKFITFLIENDGSQGTNQFVFPVLVETAGLPEVKHEDSSSTAVIDSLTIDESNGAIDAESDDNV